MSAEVKPGHVCQTGNKQAKIGTRSPFLAEAGVISETGSRISPSFKRQPLAACVDGQIGPTASDQLPWFHEKAFPHDLEGGAHP